MYLPHALVIRTAVAVSLCAAVAPAPAAAQAYPSKPIRMIVPFTPGTGIDILARTVGQKLSERWGQPVVIDNKPGASGNIGSDLTAKSPPDGYTLMMTVNTYASNASLYRKLPFDPVRDITPVMQITLGAMALGVNPSANINSVQDFISQAKSQPGKLFYGSPGVGTPHHLLMELLKQSTGIKVEHVPYKGSAGFVTDLLSGQVPISFLPIHTALPHVRAGKLKLIAVAGSKRSTFSPETPTLAESGIKAVDPDLWYGLMGPGGMPREVVDKLYREILAIASLPEVRENLNKQGMDVVTSTPEQFSALVKSDLERWARLVRETGITAE
jgi:tripartite-type tricarboxylate transporter receptor subunit TctC